MNHSKKLIAVPVFELKVNKGVEATLVQLLETGILHADPHPGNLRYTPAGQIGYLISPSLCISLFFIILRQDKLWKILSKNVC